MHLKTLRPYILLIASFSLFSCGWNKMAGPSSDEIQVRLAKPDSISAQEEGSSYSFQVVSLFKIYNLKQLSGAYAKFYINPGVENNRLFGDSPRTEFLKNQDGVYVPQNELTQQMATIYYHMQNMALLDQSVGAGDVNQWPRDVGLRVNLITEENQTQAQDNNAVYDGAFDAILIVPYSMDKIPLSLNAGVLAHEHFHSLFYKLVIKKLNLAESEDNLERVTLLKSINEGLADYWGWIYTQDENFIYSSLTEVEKTRSLRLAEGEKETVHLERRYDFQACLTGLQTKDLKCSKGLTNYAYSVGTTLAKSLRVLSEKVQSERKISVEEAQKLVAKAIVAALRTYADEIAKKENEISMKSLFISLVNKLENLKSSECETALQILTSSAMVKDEKCSVTNEVVSLK